MHWFGNLFFFFLRFVHFSIYSRFNFCVRHIIFKYLYFIIQITIQNSCLYSLKLFNFKFLIKLNSYTSSYICFPCGINILCHICESGKLWCHCLCGCLFVLVPFVENNVGLLCVHFFYARISYLMNEAFAPHYINMQLLK